MYRSPADGICHPVPSAGGAFYGAERRPYGMISERQIFNKAGAIRKDQVSDAVTEDIRMMLGEAVSGLFSRFIHIYDFNNSKLREIKGYVGTKEYEALAALLRLPGVRSLRAELYFHSGVTLEVLAEKSTEDIRNMVSDYIRRENRPEIIPQPKEINCHRAVAKMILHTEDR